MASKRPKKRPRATLCPHFGAKWTPLDPFWCPKAPPNRPQNPSECALALQGVPEAPQGRPWTPKSLQKVQKMSPKGTTNNEKWSPKATQNTPHMLPQSVWTTLSPTFYNDFLLCRPLVFEQQFIDFTRLLQTNARNWPTPNDEKHWGRPVIRRRRSQSGRPLWEAVSKLLSRCRDPPGMSSHGPAPFRRYSRFFALVN